MVMASLSRRAQVLWRTVWGKPTPSEHERGSPPLVDEIDDEDDELDRALDEIEDDEDDAFDEDDVLDGMERVMQENKRLRGQNERLRRLLLALVSSLVRPADRAPEQNDPCSTRETGASESRVERPWFYAVADAVDAARFFVPSLS